MELKIERLQIPPGKRVLAVSDIHGRAGWLSRLLDEAAFSDGDELFLLGDLIERGADNLGCLWYCRKLGERPNVHILMGNNDTVWVDVLTDEDCGSLGYMLRRRESILHEMCAALGLAVTPASDYPALRARMREAFGEELSWLAALPQIIETDEYTFVHAGLEPGALEKQRPWGVMKNDYFYEKCLAEGRRFAKPLIVGHMPTGNYCHSICSCAPLVDRTCNVVNIDGGTFRAGGQLNLVVLNGANAFSHWSTDDLPEAGVTGAQEAAADPVNLTWPDAFELLEDGEGNPIETGGLTLCRFHERKLLIPTERIFRLPDGTLHSDMATDYLLPVQPGDRVKVIRTFPGRSYCKKDGIVGWLPNDKLSFA